MLLALLRRSTINSTSRETMISCKELLASVAPLIFTWRGAMAKCKRDLDMTIKSPWNHFLHPSPNESGNKPYLAPIYLDSRSCSIPEFSLSWLCIGKLLYMWHEKNILSIANKTRTIRKLRLQSQAALHASLKVLELNCTPSPRKQLRTLPN